MKDKSLPSAAAEAPAGPVTTETPAAAADDLARRGDDEALPLRSRLGWGDFQLVLAVARCGSVVRAAPLLAQSHVTLLRKLDAIETRLKARLFDRVRGRYAATAAGEEVLAAAEAMEPLARDAELRVLGRDLRPSGHVRVAVAGILIDHLLPPVLAQFSRDYPAVTLELVSSRDHASLVRREADTALRVSDAVPDWLVGRRLGQVDFAVYALRQDGPAPRLCTVDELLPQRRWISLERDVRDLKFDRWLDTQVPASSVVLRVDAFNHALAMVRAGLGIALLPSFVQRSCPELQPLTAPIAELRTPLWALTHRELRNTTRVKVLMQALAGCLRPAGAA